MDIKRDIVKEGTTDEHRAFQKKKIVFYWL
jgi:hypothetical protein